MRTASRLLLVLLSIVSIAACGGDDSDGATKKTTTSTSTTTENTEDGGETTTTLDALEARATDYPDGYVDLGVSGCTQRGIEEKTCRCFFNGIYTTVDFEVMKEYGAKITAANRAGDDPNEVEKPAELVAIAEDCGYDFVDAAS